MKRIHIDLVADEGSVGYVLERLAEKCYNKLSPEIVPGEYYFDCGTAIVEEYPEEEE